MVYSLEIRQKALNYLSNGGKMADASQIFGVTTRTLSHWLLRAKQHDLAPRLHGSNPSKIDNQKLKKYIEENPDKYLREIAEVFSSTLQAVFYACKRLNITLKKRSRATKSGMNKSEKSFKRNEK
ncbi:MAG: IS630 transposase-related protein [Chlamydia sp.]